MQTSYSLDPAIAKEGMIADSRSLKHYVSRIAEGVIKAGLACFLVPGQGQPFSNKGGDPGSVYQNPSPVSDADVDAIVASGFGSTAGTQSFSGTALNGIVGTAKMYPARKITFVFSSHADWVATNITLVGELDGVSQTESIAIPNGGNATVTSTKYYDKVTSFAVPAQSGTGGTATVGVAALDASVTLADFEGFAIYDNCLVPNTIPSQDQTGEYHDKDIVSVMQRGAMWVITENAASKNGTVHARISGGQLGAVRADTDSGAAIALTGWRFASDASANALVKIEYV